MSRGIIVLDPGHGQFGNPHPTKEGYYEGTQNFILGCFLRDELVSLGFEVLMTRNKVEDDPSLAERGHLAGDNGAILFMSLHSNAPGNPTTEEAKLRYPTIRGVSTYYSVSDMEGNEPLATAINIAVAKTMGTPDRGIKTRRLEDTPEIDYYGVLRNSAASGCKRAILVEHGFHTSPDDSAFLQSSECLARLAKAEAEVIDKFFN